MKPDMRCGTCKFWEPPNGNGESQWGTCKLATALDFAQPESELWHSAVMAQMGVEDGRLATTKEFGCTEYQPLDK